MAQKQGARQLDHEPIGRATEPFLAHLRQPRFHLGTLAWPKINAAPESEPTFYQTAQLKGEHTLHTNANKKLYVLFNRHHPSRERLEGKTSNGRLEPVFGLWYILQHR